MSTHQSAADFPKLGGLQALTAGTTQTQAGATQITAPFAKVTTGNANDGVGLPRADFPNRIDQVVIVSNQSAVALRVYPAYISADAAGDGSQIDGGGANVFFAQPASSTYAYVQTAHKTWVSFRLALS